MIHEPRAEEPGQTLHLSRGGGRAARRRRRRDGKSAEIHGFTHHAAPPGLQRAGLDGLAAIAAILATYHDELPVTEAADAGEQQGRQGAVGRAGLDQQRDPWRLSVLGSPQVPARFDLQSTSNGPAGHGFPAGGAFDLRACSTEGDNINNHTVVIYSFSRVEHPRLLIIC